jgi:hypothetical protein
MNDLQMHKELRRLERDVEDFRVRAAAVKATLEHSGRSVMSDPLHQRLSSIHEFLRDRLKDVQKEATKRAAAAPASPGSSVKSLIGALPRVRIGRGRRALAPET